MPNGTGKTTTLSMLRAALSGSAKQWSGDEILNFRSLDEDTDYGQFTVSLDVDSTIITFELNLDFAEKKISYRTT
jgi:DNA sulfur modification protein DndD